MDTAVEKLDKINRTLEKQNEIIQRMLDIMPGPENRFIRTLETIVLIAGMLGVFNTIDIVRRWIIGG